MRREEKRAECEEKGIEYESDEEEEEETEIVPYITKEMLMTSLSQANKSVTKADLERYMKYKRDMERRIGMDTKKGGGSSPAPPPTFANNGGSNPEPAPTINPATRNFDDDSDDSDDDIYDD